MPTSHDRWSVGQHEKQAKDFTTRTQHLQAAFQRHRLGRDKEGDRKLLGDWIAKIEDEVTQVRKTPSWPKSWANYSLP